MELNNRKILIVEDERIVAEDIRDTLANSGFDVIGSVASGEEAIGLVKKNKPDLVLMDISIEGDLDGTQLAKVLHDQFGIPVIYLTAFADDDTINKAKYTVPMGFIVKPFNESELRASVEMALYRNQVEKDETSDFNWSKQAIDVVDEGVIVTNKNNKIKFMNSAAEKITGWFIVEAHNKSLADVFCLKRSDASKLLVGLSEGDESSHNSSFRISNAILVQAGGKGETNIDLIATSNRKATGEWIGSTLIIRDLSKKLDQNQIQSQINQKDILNEKMEALQALIEGLSHGINNSLTGSIGFLELLRQHESFEAKFQEWTDLALTGCKDAAALINKIRCFCKTTLRDPTRIELNNILSETLVQLTSQIGEDIIVKNSASDKPIWILGENNQIEHAVVNILINAALAIPNGGTIEVNTFREVLKDSESDPNSKSHNYGVISIRDSGVGIEPEAITKIFDPFYTTLRDGKVFGRGLGLTLAYGVVRNHGGWINVESTKGIGSTFKLYFPEIE